MPYGGRLVDLLVSSEALDALKAYVSHLSSLQLSDRAVCDLKLLSIVAFSPFDRFMGQEDHQRVLEEMRLANGASFPIPVILPADPSPALRFDQDIALHNPQNELLAS
jgi:sulfate adenylyltransferase